MTSRKKHPLSASALFFHTEIENEWKVWSMKWEVVYRGLEACAYLERKTTPSRVSGSYSHQSWDRKPGCGTSLKRMLTLLAAYLGLETGDQILEDLLDVLWDEMAIEEWSEELKACKDAEVRQDESYHSSGDLLALSTSCFKSLASHNYKMLFQIIISGSDRVTSLHSSLPYFW